MNSKVLEYFEVRESNGEDLPIQKIREYAKIFALHKSESKTFWSCVSRQCCLEALIEFEDKINWFNASVNKNLTLDLVKNHQSDLNMKYISQFANLEIIEYFVNLDSLYNRVDWNFISKNKNLSVEFVKKHQDKLNWEDVSIYLPLYMLIKEFPHKIDFEKISSRVDIVDYIEETIDNQPLSDLLIFDYIVNNPNLTLEIIDKYKHRMLYTKNIRRILTRKIKDESQDSDDSFDSDYHQ